MSGSSIRRRQATADKPTKSGIKPAALNACSQWSTEAAGSVADRHGWWLGAGLRVTCEAGRPRVERETLAESILHGLSQFARPAGHALKLEHGKSSEIVRQQHRRVGCAHGAEVTDRIRDCVPQRVEPVNGGLRTKARARRQPALGVRQHLGTGAAGAGDHSVADLEDKLRLRVWQHLVECLKQEAHSYSMKVTLSISRSVVMPSRTRSTADSRSVHMPS